MPGSRWFAPLLLTVLIGAAGIGAAALMYEISAGTHGGAALSATGIWADVLGVALALLFAGQLMTGYRYLLVAQNQYALHSATGWVVLAAVSTHGLLGSIHALRPPREALPLWLIVLGVAITAVLVWQAASASRRRNRHERPQRHHAVIGLVVGLAVLAHVAIGALHVITG